MSFFFFSSRRRHTRFKCDWSSDVCSSDLCSRTLLAAFPLLLRLAVINRLLRCQNCRYRSFGPRSFGCRGALGFLSLDLEWRMFCMNRFFPFDGDQFQLIHQERWLPLDRYLDVVVVLDLCQLTLLAVKEIIGDFQRQLSAHLGSRPFCCGGMDFPQERDRHVLD